MILNTHIIITQRKRAEIQYDEDGFEIRERGHFWKRWQQGPPKPAPKPKTSRPKHSWGAPQDTVGGGFGSLINMARPPLPFREQHAKYCT